MKTAGKKLIVIAGPTAVGKTSLSIYLAKKLKTEIISADSRQFYRELTIGTAKPSSEELAAVRHHFVNSHSITQKYDAASFGNDALACIHDLFKSHDHVVLCGGSGLYIKAVCEGFDDIPEVAEEVREALVRGFETEGLSWLQDQMREMDPDYFKTVDQQNPHRLIRALEVKIGTGQSITTFRQNVKRSHDFRIIKIGLDLPREELYRRIDERMEDMIRRGLFDEAQTLYPFKDHLALQTVGYQEIFDFIAGKYDRDETVRLLKRNSRHYAKRQLTWFRRDPDLKWFLPDQTGEISCYLDNPDE